MPRKQAKPKPTEGQPSLFDGVVSDDSRHAGIPGVAVEVSREDAEIMGAFEEDALSFDDVLESQHVPAEGLDGSPEGIGSAHQQRLSRLREHHRVLSEMIVSEHEPRSGTHRARD